MFNVPSRSPVTRPEGSVLEFTIDVDSFKPDERISLACREGIPSGAATGRVAPVFRRDSPLERGPHARRAAGTPATPATLRTC